MKKPFKLTIAYILLSTSLYTHSAYLDCGVVKLNEVMIQGDRDDGHPHANSLYLVIDSFCDGANGFYIKNTHPAYNGFVSLALTAYSTTKKINMAVNTSNKIDGSTQISILRTAD